MSDIRPRSGLSIPVISRKCQILESMGLIEIRVAKDSRREKNLFLTREGEKARDEISNELLRAVDEIAAISK